MDLRTISFCDKTAYNITNDNYKEIIVNILKKNKVNVLEKNNYYNENVHKKELLNNEYIFSYKTKGNNYIVLLTKINNKKKCFFIDRKINKGYIYPRILLVHYRFHDDVYNDTILTGELLLNNNKWDFYFNNIFYYCGHNLYKYNIYDRLNNIKNILTKYYISDSNIEPCELKIKKYYPINKINCLIKIKDLIGIEFIEYGGNKKIYYQFVNNNKNRNINRNINKIQNKMNGIFKIEKTNQIDIYKLYCMKKNNLYHLGIARIDSNNSNLLYNYFKDKPLSHKRNVNCNYNKYFKKWTPMNFTNENKIDDYFDIKDFLNKI